MKEPLPFEKELISLINRYSKENLSNTPDFILAQYLQGCLIAFDMAVQQREHWYGRDPKPVGQPIETEEGIWKTKTDQNR
jgi:hypothetical protein